MIHSDKKNISEWQIEWAFIWIRHRVTVLDRLGTSLSSPEGANVSHLSNFLLLPFISTIWSFMTMDFLKNLLTVWVTLFCFFGSDLFAWFLLDFVCCSLKCFRSYIFRIPTLRPILTKKFGSKWSLYDLEIHVWKFAAETGNFLQRTLIFNCG